MNCSGSSCSSDLPRISLLGSHSLQKWTWDMGREQLSVRPAPHLLCSLIIEMLTLAQVNGLETTARDVGKKKGWKSHFQQLLVLTAAQAKHKMNPLQGNCSFFHHRPPKREGQLGLKRLQRERKQML